MSTLRTIVVTLVGKATDLTITLTVPMDNMVCGDVRKIDITAVDTNGETVADGTAVIVSTNFGGVLTGAASGRFAPSSTAVETKDGVVSVYLITSDTHVGDYAVVASAGYGVAYLTVACGMEMGMELTLTLTLTLPLSLRRPPVTLVWQRLPAQAGCSWPSLACWHPLW